MLHYTKVNNQLQKIFYIQTIHIGNVNKYFNVRLCTWLFSTSNESKLEMVIMVWNSENIKRTDVDLLFYVGQAHQQ